MTVIEPVDNVMMEALVKDIAYLDGPVYLRVNRKEPVQIYAPAPSLRLARARSSLKGMI